jgi:hypothetical protein
VCIATIDTANAFAVTVVIPAGVNVTVVPPLAVSTGVTVSNGVVPSTPRYAAENAKNPFDAPDDAASDGDASEAPAIL